MLSRVCRLLADPNTAKRRIGSRKGLWMEKRVGLSRDVNMSAPDARPMVG